MSPNVPPSRLFARRVDSLAHVNVPQSYTPGGEQQVVTVLFDADARVTRWFTRPRASGESVAATIASHGPAELLASVLPAPLPAFSGYGAFTFKDAPRTIFLFAQMGRTGPMRRASVFEARAIVMLKPIMKKQVDEYGSTGVLPSEERSRTVLVYTTGDAAMSEGGEAPTSRRDTLRIRLPGTVSLDLSRPGDVHFVSEDGRPFDLAAMLAGTATREVGARGRHVIMMSVGQGVRTVE